MPDADPPAIPMMIVCFIGFYLVVSIKSYYINFTIAGTEKKVIISYEFHRIDDMIEIADERTKRRETGEKRRKINGIER